ADWTNFRCNGHLDQFFSEPCNVGILLGENSGGLVDVDLDSSEAISLAPHFLPATGAIFGRMSKPRSHHLYRVKPAPATTRFCDIGGSCLVELRSTRAQTVFPPSTHPSGETIEWCVLKEPAQVDGEKLMRSVSLLAGGVLLVRHYPLEGSRQDLALALSGA